MSAHDLPPGYRTNVPETVQPGLGQFTVRLASEFAAVDEPGAQPLVGSGDQVVIPEGGDVMVYGTGGAGKTTLTIDLACHLAAGDDWLGVPVDTPARVLLVENEGPRPLLRKKLGRKLAAWTGSPIGDRLLVLETPWAKVTLDDEEMVGRLSDEISSQDVDVLVIGPVTRAGMNDAGTLQEVRDFMGLVGRLRELDCNGLAVVLVHHEGKRGDVSGAWEGAVDTLFHVTGQGHGRTRLHVQKARWASDYHGTSLNLVWAPGDGYRVDDEPDVADDDLRDQILHVISMNPGIAWKGVEEAVQGASRDRRNQIRNGLLAAGTIVNVSGRPPAALDRVEQGKRTSLYLARDELLGELLRDPGEVAEKSAPASPVGAMATSPRPPSPRGGGEGEVADPPAANGNGHRSLLDPDEWVRERLDDGSWA